MYAVGSDNGFNLGGLASGLIDEVEEWQLAAVEGAAPGRSFPNRRRHVGGVLGRLAHIIVG